MATTNVPLPEFTAAGLLTYDEQAILGGVQQDYVQAFALNGKTLSTELTTPQGQLMQSQAFMVAAFQAALAQLVAQVDPLTASGAYQDALGRIYSLTRQAATKGTVQATVLGVVGNTLPAGSQAQSLVDGSLWETTAVATFGSHGGGAALVTFRAMVAGSGPVVGINGLRIYQTVAGWESITNSAGSVPGTDTESRAQFEARRQASVQIGGSGTVAAIKAAIDNVSGVTDSFVYNNTLDTATTFGATAYPIPAHSVAISVAGGLDTLVAQAIWSKIDCGCGFSTQGTTAVAVQDTVNYSPPYPSYDIRFVRPAVTQVYITANIAATSDLPANYAPLVQAAIADAFANGYITSDGIVMVRRARIGSQIIAGEFSAPVLALPNITPVSFRVGFSAAPSTGEAVTMGIDQLPTCPALNVTVNTVSV